MARFQTEKKSGGGLLLPLCLFAIILTVFFVAVSIFSSADRRKQMENLENALHRSITYCYAMEGAYPESLDQLLEKYGITYDKSSFLIDYHTLGANIYPDVTVLERK